MSTPSDGAPESGAANASATDPDRPDAPSRPPWVWIAVCGVLAVAVVGLTIWALNSQSDLDQQRDATAQAQQEADLANQQADELSSQVDQIAQGGADAKQKFQSALAELKGKLSSLADKLKPPEGGSGTPDAGATPPATATATSAVATPTASATPVENATP